MIHAAINDDISWNSHIVRKLSKSVIYIYTVHTFIYIALANTVMAFYNILFFWCNRSENRRYALLKKSKNLILLLVKIVPCWLRLIFLCVWFLFYDFYGSDCLMMAVVEVWLYFYAIKCFLLSFSLIRTIWWERKNVIKSDSSLLVLKVKCTSSASLL